MHFDDIPQVTSWGHYAVWNPAAWVEVTFEGGYVLPWAKLYDRYGQEALGQPTPQEVPVSLCCDDEWEVIEEKFDPTGAS